MFYTILILIIIILASALIIGVRRVEKTKEEKILTIFNQKERIANDDVQKLLKVSDATATRYLDKLEKVGKIEQVGKTGRHVFYKIKR